MNLYILGCPILRSMRHKNIFYKYLNKSFPCNKCIEKIRNIEIFTITFETSGQKVMQHSVEMAHSIRILEEM